MNSGFLLKDCGNDGKEQRRFPLLSFKSKKRGLRDAPTVLVVKLRRGGFLFTKGGRKLSKREKILKKLKDLGEKFLKGDITEDEINSLLNKSSETSEEDYGIPEGFKVKRRQYTFSLKALEQRREAAKNSTGPKSAEGKKISSQNAWLHGVYAQSFIRKYKKPCKSTCPEYPCKLIEDGKTQPGEECLDKEHVYEAWNAIMKAVVEKKFDDFNALAALDTSNNIQILRKLQEAILEDGVVLKHDKIDKDGNTIGKELRQHPALIALQKMTETLGFTPRDLMITPKEIEKAGRDEEGLKTAADLMSLVGNTLKKKAEG